MIGYLFVGVGVGADAVQLSIVACITSVYKKLGENSYRDSR
jgi:hypothetical protein